MSKKKHPEYIPYKFFPFAMLILLMVGVIVSLAQVQKPQSTQSKADSISPTTTTQNCTVYQSQLSISTEEQTVFNQINTYRVAHGSPPLVWSETLKKAAEWRSNDMLMHGTLSAIDSFGRTYMQRIPNCGYPASATLGENIDSGTADPNRITSTWQHVPAYNANLLNPAFKEAAVAMAPGSDAVQTYWTLNLAGPAPTSGPISPTISSLTPHPSISTNPSISSIPITQIVLPSLTPLPITQFVVPSITPTSLPTKPFTPTSPPTPTMTPIPTPDPSYKQNAFDTQIVISAKVNGIGGNNPKHLTRKVDVEIYDVENKLVLTGHGFLKYNSENIFRGIIHLGKMDNGIYYVKVLSEHMLKTEILPRFQDIRNTRLNILPEITIQQGDLDSNNAVTIEDYNIALPCFQDKKCKNPELIDFNDNGIANVTDYNILLEAFERYKGD